MAAAIQPAGESAEHAEDTAAANPGSLIRAIIIDSGSAGDRLAVSNRRAWQEPGIVAYSGQPDTSGVPGGALSRSTPISFACSVIMPVGRAPGRQGVESRLVPVNAILDLALADGLNPAPLADAGWTVSALEVPVKVNGETVICDVVLFNPLAGHLLAVEAKSGANLEPEQGRRLTALTPQLLVIAGGITVPKPVPLRCGVLYACLAGNADRICLGADEAGLRVPVLAVSGSEATLLRPQLGDPLLSAVLSSPLRPRSPKPSSARRSGRRAQGGRRGAGALPLRTLNRGHRGTGRRPPFP
jgi:hypothetical protein